MFPLRSLLLTSLLPVPLVGLYALSRWDGTQDPFGTEVDVRAVLESMSDELLSGYGLELAGASRDQQEVFTQMAIALVMASGIATFTLVPE